MDYHIPYLYVQIVKNLDSIDYGKIRGFHPQNDAQNVKRLFYYIEKYV